MDFFSNNNLVSKVNDFRQQDRFYDTPCNQFRVYTKENNMRAIESIFGGILQNKASNYFDNNNNKSVMIDYQDENDIFRIIEKNPNSRSTSYLGDSSYIYQTQQHENIIGNQYKNNGFNSSTPNQFKNGINNKYFSKESDEKESPFRCDKYLNKSECKPKSNVRKEYNHIETNRYKVGPDFALKMRIQKCESTGDFQQNNQSSILNYQDTQLNKNSNTSQILSNNNEDETYQNTNGINKNHKNIPTKNDKDFYKGVISRNQTEESFGYSPSQETKSSYSTHNFDSFKSQMEQTPKEQQITNQGTQQSKKSKLSDFQQQWENLNQFKYNSQKEEEKQQQEAFEKFTNFSAGKIDFKQIKLSRTPLETIDVRQQLANIDQNAKLEAYGESIQLQEQTKINYIIPSFLQQSGSVLDDLTLKQTQDQDQQAQLREINNHSREIKCNILFNSDQVFNQQSENKNLQNYSIQNENKQLYEYDDVENMKKIQKNQSLKSQNEIMKQNQIDQKEISQKQDSMAKEKAHPQQDFSQKQSSLIELKTEKSKEQRNQSYQQVCLLKNETIQKNLNKNNYQHKNVIEEQQNLEIEAQNLDKQNENNLQITQKYKISQENKNKSLDEQKQDSTTKIIQVEQKYQIQNVINKKQIIDEEQDDRLKQLKPIQNTQQKQKEINAQNHLEQQQAEQSSNNFNQKQIPSLNIPQNHNKLINGDNQNSSRGQVDLTGIVQNIRSIKQGLQEKRKGKNTPSGNISKNSASVLQNDSSETPQFKLNDNQITDFSQALQNENGKDLESIRKEIFSNLKTDMKEQENQREQQSELRQQNYKNNDQTYKETPKNNIKLEMVTIEEEQRTNKESIDFQHSEISFQENIQEQIYQNEMSFNGECLNNQFLPINDIDEVVQIDTNDNEQTENHNFILQQEFSIDLIVRYQQLLDESCNASVKNLPLNYTKEMVNLAYSILQTVRNCSQFPQHEDDYQQDQF